MTRPQTSHRSHDAVAAIIAALLWGPKTRQDLAEITGVSENTIDHSLCSLQKHGLVYRHSLEPDKGPREDGTRIGGAPRILWAINSTPFANSDRVTKRGRPLPKEPDHVNRSIS